MENGRAVELEAIAQDPEPSPIAAGMIGALDDPVRIGRPMVRRSFLEHGHRGGGAGRGAEPSVEVDWEQAIALVAGEIDRIRATHGNRAIYAGSYGWASAGRFHHAQSQIHRFFNAAGGYTRSVQNYSFAAASTILPHVIGDIGGLGSGHTCWRSIIDHGETIIAFGGLPARNSQVNAGGVGRHILSASLQAARDRGVKLISVSPIRDDVAEALDCEWIPIRPGTDTAMMLGMAHEMLASGLYDAAFLDRYTTGFDRFRAYVDGSGDGIAKSPEWASAICGIAAATIRRLARLAANTRTMLMMAWSLQRADHGEQPCWMLITLAAMTGWIGLPGGGFGFGYGSVNGIGNAILPLSWPSLAQGTNPVDEHIPVARITDMLERPGEPYDFNGERRTYPDVRMVYWAGGNPFHHHQDLNRLRAAWRRPEVVIVHDSWWNALARHADIVLPVTTQLERNDIACAARDRFIAASHRVAEPHGESRSDYEVFADLAGKLGVRQAFTEGRDEEAWLRHLFGVARERLTGAGFDVPDFDRFWSQGLLEFPEPADDMILLSAFRRDPVGNALSTPSGRIEIHSDRIAAFGYDDCLGHPAWFAPREGAAAPAAQRFPLHLLSSQPRTKLHSQYDNGAVSRAAKIDGREPVRIHPDDAARRNIGAGDIVRLFNDRGACLAGAVLSDALSPGVVQMATGAWYDPDDPVAATSLDKHGNPNVLTADVGTSRLAQGCSAQACLIEIERYEGEPPPVTAFVPPVIIRAG